MTFNGDVLTVRVEENCRYPMGMRAALDESTITRQKSLNPRPLSVKSTMFGASHNYCAGCLWHACAFEIIQNGRTENNTVHFHFHKFRNMGKNCLFLAGVQLTSRGLCMCVCVRCADCGA